MASLLIDSRYEDALRALELSSFAGIQHFFLPDREDVPPGVFVAPRDCGLADGSVLQVFYKQYEYPQSSWSFFGRRSKARREFDNYAVFARLGIASADRIACGEQRDRLGRLRRAFIVTRAVPGAMTLTEFVAAHCPSRKSASQRKLRASLRTQLAGMTGRIHGAGFFHNDLVWRNILVTWQPPKLPRVWWIDCPRGSFDRWSPSRQRRRLKDLALLNKLASRLCTRGECCTFIKEYLGKTRLDEETKNLIHRTLAYQRRRWPKGQNES